MRRSSFLTSVVAAALALSATAAAAQERFDGSDALDTDDITVDVVCPDPSSIDGVVGIGEEGGPGGRLVYMIEHQFDPQPYSYVWYVGQDEADLTQRQTGTNTSPGSGAGLWYPPVGEDHLVQQMVYSLTNSGAAMTITATFDDNGCITDVDHDDAESGVSIQFLQAETDVPLDNVTADVGEEIIVDVLTSNTGVGTLGEEWWTGFEIENLEDANNLTLEWFNPQADGPQWLPVAVEVINDNGIQVAQVKGAAHPEALEPGQEVLRRYRATFTETGSFTGTVFVFGQNI